MIVPHQDHKAVPEAEAAADAVPHGQNPAGSDDSTGDDATKDDLALTVGHNLRRLRTRRGYSLERLAKLSGVSRAMLGQIETGRSVPTINLLWKVSRALDVPFAALTTGRHEQGTVLLRKANAKILLSQTGHFTSRALFPFDSERKVEFYELRLAGRSLEQAEPHAPGTLENLVVAHGTMEIEAGGESHTLEPGDAILFQADVPHSYRNLGDAEAVMYLVMIYVETIG